MKPSYFEQTASDKDDHILQKMIALGKVPGTCLLGGTMVQHAVSQGFDPCESCPCPKRDVCGGRDRGVGSDVEDLAPTTAETGRTFVNDEATARRLIRKKHNAKLREMMAQAEKERGS